MAQTYDPKDSAREEIGDAIDAARRTGMDIREFIEESKRMWLYALHEEIIHIQSLEIK